MTYATLFQLVWPDLWLLLLAGSDLPCQWQVYNGFPCNLAAFDVQYKSVVEQGRVSKVLAVGLRNYGGNYGDRN